MKQTIRSYLKSGISKRSLFAGGAFIAASAFGLASPEGIQFIHDALQFSVSMTPFQDPAAMIRTLYDGAIFHSASAIEAAGSFLEGVGAELGQRARQALEEARSFLGPMADQGKNLFMETAGMMGEAAVVIRDNIRNATMHPEALQQIAKDVVDSGLEVIRAGAEAWGIYEIGKKVYEGIFSRGKKEISQKISAAGEKADEKTINLNLNISIGGGEVADQAMRTSSFELIKSLIDPTSGLSAMDESQIIRLTDGLNRRISNDINDLMAAVKDAPSSGIVSLSSPPARRFEDSLSPIEDLKHRARFPMINWGESLESEARFEGLRGKTLKPTRLNVRINHDFGDDSKRMRVVDPFTLRGGGSLSLSDDGVLVVDRPCPDVNEIGIN